MKIVLYYPRVGRGYESQQEKAEKFLKRNKTTAIAEFYESGPGLVELRKAMAKAMAVRGTLVITQLIGTISKSLNFMQALGESDVDFIAINMRKFNRKTLPTFTARAQDECHRKRQEIKDAMAEKKEHGAVFGSARKGHWNRRNRPLLLAATRKAAQASAKVRRKLADDAYAHLMPKMLEMKARGDGPTVIAESLNMAGHLTAKGMPFTAPTVFKILKRHGGQNVRAGTKDVGRKAHFPSAQR